MARDRSDPRTAAPPDAVFRGGFRRFPPFARGIGGSGAARRARSRFELETLLKNCGFADEIIQSVICQCEKQNYLNDAEFARELVRKRLATRPVSRKRLEQILNKYGIDHDIIDATIDSAFTHEDEIRIANQAANKRWERLKTLPPQKARLRLINFLRSRGFDWEVIQKIDLWNEQEIYKTE